MRYVGVFVSIFLGGGFTMFSHTNKNGQDIMSSTTLFFCVSITDEDQITTSPLQIRTKLLHLWKILSSLLLGSLDLRLDLPKPLNPIFTGTAGISVFYGRYQWHCDQSIIHYHLLHSNLIPQHPVHLPFTCSNHPQWSFIPFQKIVPSFGNSFLFYVDPWLTESRIFQAEYSSWVPCWWWDWLINQKW